MKYFIFFFLVSFSIQAQSQVNGIIKDFSSGQPLAFASINTPNGIKTLSDVDGKFSISAPSEIEFISVTYIGHVPATIKIKKNQHFYPIFLQQKAEELQPINLFNKNNALWIIKKTISLKDENNPQKRLNSFKFKSYNKLIVTANPDSISGKIDSVFIQRAFGKKFLKIDSTNYKFKETISKRHLFQIEKVSQYQFANSTLIEAILGTKMAGLKQPLYEILGFNLQSFSIYDSSYELFETNYKSPISSNALKDYNYKLLDTLTLKNRPCYMIYFKNKKKRKSAGLEGVLYIDQNSFAVSKAVMRTRGLLDITGIHQFDYYPEENLWFPTRKSFKIIKGKNDDNINILGGTIQFDGETERGNIKRKREPSDFTYLLSETNIFDIEFSKSLRLKKSFNSIVIDKQATNRKESFWNLYREDSLDNRSITTYKELDSIAVKRKIANKIFFGKRVINGFIPLGNFDMDLRKLFSYNNYEGFRLGFGGRTNNRFSENSRIEGYSAYGTKDGNFKYNLGTAVRIEKNSDSWLGISYTNDIREIASTNFIIEKKPFKVYDPRPINISTFYNYESWKTFVETKKIPKTDGVLEITHSHIDPKFNYQYNHRANSYSNFDITAAMLSLQWSPFSDFMKTPTGRIEIEKRFPKFTFQLTQTLGNLWDNDFNFSKFDFKTDYEKKYLNGQKTSLYLQAGYALGDIPLTHLYNTSPNNITKETILKRITFGGKNSFETMYFNEFFSDKYAYFQFKHAFNRVQLLTNIKPSMVLVSRMAYGNLQQPDNHTGLDFKTLKDGYFESGIEFNQILNGLGLTAFYRYGPNQLPKFEDNLAIKLSFILHLGL